MDGSGGGGLGCFGWGPRLARGAAGAGLIWLGHKAGLPAGVSACGEVAGWGVWLLGFRLAGVAAGAGGCG